MTWAYPIVQVAQVMRMQAQAVQDVLDAIQEALVVGGGMVGGLPAQHDPSATGSPMGQGIGAAYLPPAISEDGEADWSSPHDDHTSAAGAAGQGATHGAQSRGAALHVSMIKEHQQQGLLRRLLPGITILVAGVWGILKFRPS